VNATIALGLGDNVDYEIVWDSHTIEALILEHNIRRADITPLPVIHSERELLISILSFLQAGTGGERWVSSSAIVERFAHRFPMLVTLGGTSVRAAIAMRKLGYTSALHLVTINEHVRRLIPQDSPYVCSNTEESLYPHLIVQFDKGAQIRAGDIDIRASRPNRIIYHNDQDNIIMRLNEAYGDLITHARVFLISGFNAMQSEELLRDRLATLQRIMGRLPADALVFFEDAAYYNPAFCELTLAELGPHLDIYSLNEDELMAHVGRTVDLLHPEEIRDALAALHKRSPIPTIVVHSMYWALAYGEDAPRMARALKGGVTMATTRFRYGDDFTESHYRQTEALPPNEAGAHFAREIEALLGNRVCCIPVAHVEQANATTIGLGDAFVGGFLPALLE